MHLIFYVKHFLILLSPRKRCLYTLVFVRIKVAVDMCVFFVCVRVCVNGAEECLKEGGSVMGFVDLCG